MTRKVGVIGSRTFPVDTAVGTQIVDELRSLGDVAILTRGSGDFEKFIAVACMILGLRCFEYPGQGGWKNYVRDAELVLDCDELLAFLDPNLLDDPHTGTKMVIERALNAGKPVKVGTVARGELVWASA